MKSPSGFEIYIGKNARQNEYLSLHVLTGNDYWFHVEGKPGPHVILKVPKGLEPTKLDLSFAKSFAGEGAITVARGTDVVKVKGDPLGTFRIVSSSENCK